MAKLKFSGSETWALVNTDTGELGTPEDVLEFAASLTPSPPTEKKRSNFAVLYPLKFYGMVNAIGSKKMEVISYIIKHMGADNVLIATAKEIAEQTRISEITVKRTLQALAKANLIHRRPGVIMLNPQLLNRKHRAGEYKLMLKFDEIERSGNDDGKRPAKDDKPPEKQEPPQS